MASVPLVSEEQLLCPICLGLMVKPVSTPCGHNFCMSCLSSYWDSIPVCLCPVCKESFSLRPQLRVNTFISGLSQSFSLLELREDPQDRLCPQHQRPLCSYCPEEGAVLCEACQIHSRHRRVPLEQAYKELRVQLDQNQAKVSSQIHHRVQTVCSIRETKTQRQQETRRVISQSEQLLQNVLHKVQKNHKDLVQKMEQQQQREDSEAEALLTQAEQEIADLVQTQTKLQDLKQTQDPLLFLKKHPNMSLVRASSVSTLSYGEELEEMRESLERYTSRIKDLLEKLVREIPFSDDKPLVLKHLQKYALDLKLDPDTAHPWLTVSPDLSQVWYQRRAQLSVNNSRRFLNSYSVAADRGFSSGQIYFEVSVGQKEEWLLGLIGESVPRGEPISGQNRGVWVLSFRVDTFYNTCNKGVPVHFGKVERVGVFVDYDKGLVSFYDVKTATCIYSFTRCVFREKIFPFLNPCDDEFPSYTVPMIIVPVGRR